MIAYYPILIILFPLTAALITALPGNLLGKKAYKIGVLFKIVSLAISVQVLREVATSGHSEIHLPVFSSTWNGLLQFDFHVDRLAAVMMVLVSCINLLVSLFSIRYMQGEWGLSRFYTLMDIATFALLCMVSSANLLMLFIFWQLLSWLLSLLIHNYSHLPTAKGSFKTFTILRAGDVAFLGGIILAYHLYGTLDFRELFTRAAEVSATFSLLPGGGLEISVVTVITLLIFAGAMSKSVQFPLHVWLPDFLYAPTPVTAFLHAGIINAGGFLLNRLAPLYVFSPTTLHVVFSIGLLTALLGASMMLTQNSIKKTLGYSTIAQMGYMIMECGLGAFSLAIFHLIAHGLFKATIFLNCGHVIHDARQEPRFPIKEETVKRMGFSVWSWLTGFITTLVIPLVILLAAHGVLKIPVKDSHGIVIFLFFSWVTSSQAIMSLYRLRSVSWEVVTIMLLTMLLIVFTYLLAAEKFTYFLYPSEGEVHQYYQAAALHGRLFDSLVAATALFITLSWIFIYAKTHGQTIRMPKWLNVLQVHLYLLFMNRLYLDAFFLRFKWEFMRIIHRFDKSAPCRYVLALIAAGLVLSTMVLVGDMSAANIIIFFVSAHMLPLFPFHGVYVTTLTRLPGYFPVFFSFLLPVMGLYGMAYLLPIMSALVLKGVSVLALFGAIYGSLKALIQYRVTHALVYMNVALFSVLWWYLANTGTYTPQAATYTGSVALVTSGLFFALYRIQVRYGNMSMDRIGGLARPMPRFAVLLSLLVMAAMGLPPFGFFFSYVEMLLHPSIAISWDMIIVLLALFAASWCFFRLMQRLLFGPCRQDILYKDLCPTEFVFLMIVILILAALGIMPYGFFKAHRHVINFLY